MANPKYTKIVCIDISARGLLQKPLSEHPCKLHQLNHKLGLGL
jgi:hypothetical protein